MTEENNQNPTQGEQIEASEVQEQSQNSQTEEQNQAGEQNQENLESQTPKIEGQPETPPEVTGYEGTGHEKDPLKAKPSTGREGTEQ